jgi:glycerol-1-phosphate dehydrogenase [NAD(P)+]
MTVSAFPLGDLRSVLNHLSTADPDGALVPCRISRIRLGRDQVGSVTDEVAALLGERRERARVVLVVDATPIQRQGEDLKDLVETQLRQRFDVHREVLTDEHPALHADEHAIEAASRAAAGADAVVTIGGGTITDIGKLASIAAGDLPLVVVQTAASVDGFTDNVSVILRSGVKRTLDSRWPDVVIADVETISEAPATMNRAGFGEITSMFTAPADWKLASVLHVDTSFHPAPTELLAGVGSDINAWSPGVAAADVDAVERLTWALAVRGIATGVSGSTAVLSGVEHLISHMFDLHHSESGLPLGFHGAQVGAAAVVAAAAWELLLERLDDGAPTVRLPDTATARMRVEAAFGHFGDRIVDECWRDYSRKLGAWSDGRTEIEAALASWAEHAPGLRRLVRPSADIARQLRPAGAAATFADLDPTVEPGLARWAVTNCALMRNRTTVVDLLTFLGWWEPDDVERVLTAAQSAGGQSAGSDPVSRGGSVPSPAGAGR